MNRPATLWFWKDWESDVALKDCSLAAQGLWMRMLCIAAQHDPTGYVSIGSVGLSAERIARIVGAGVQETERLIGELSLNGVFSRDRNGTIYNRRMVRDAKKAKVAQKNGKLGGNPILTCRTQPPHPSDHELPKSPPEVSISKISENSASVKGQDKGGLKALDKLKPIPLEDSSLRSESLIPYQDSQTEPIDQKPKPKTDNGDFEKRFWPAYPHKIGKPAAARAFATAIKKASIEQILAGLARYVRDKPPDRPWCNPATWLNQDRWLDQPAPASASNGHAKPNGRSNGTAEAVRWFLQDGPNEPDHKHADDNGCEESPEPNVERL
jgi:hypothetical protein